MINRIKTLFKNAYFFAIVTKIIIALNGLVFQILLSRYLGAELKGNITYVGSVLIVTSLVMTFGFHQVYPNIRKNNSDIESAKNEFMSFITVLFLAYLFISIVAFFIIRSYFLNLAFAILFSPVYSLSYISSTVYLVERPNKRNLMMLVASLIELITCLLIYLLSPRLYLIGIVLLVVGESVRCFLFFFGIRFHFSFHYIHKSNISFLIKHGFILMLALLLNTLNYKIDVLMLKQFNNVADSDIGVYSVGIAIAEKVILVPDSVKEILLSKLSKDGDENNVCRAMRICFPVSIVVSIVICLLSYPLINVFFGEEYSGAFLITCISVGGVAAMVFMKMIDMYNTVHLWQKANILLLSIAIIINVFCNLLFIPIYGIVGAAISTIIGHLVCSLAFLIFFRIKTRISFSKMLFVQKEDFKYAINFIKRKA